MSRFLLICLGGAIGTGARYALTGWIARALGATFPWGTLAVNVLGSFLLSVVMYVGLNTEVMSVTTRTALAVGVLGGFTTYSSFSYETLECFRRDAWLLGLTNVGLTLITCLLASVLGLWVGRLLAGGVD